MRSGAAADRPGYFHEAVRYHSDAELLDVVVPFLAGGPVAGEPTYVACGNRTTALLRDVLPPSSGVEFLPAGDTYARPAAAIRAYQALLSRDLATGVDQIRVVGEVPTAGPTWHSWARYEAAINHAFDGFPLWSLCPYDARVTPPGVLDDVARTHPSFAAPGDRHEPSSAYTQPPVFLSEHRTAAPDPLQAAPPAATLVDATPAEARRAVRELGAGLAPESLDDLIIAVNETVTNAFLYGHPPVHVRIWAGATRVVVAVTDAGRGPGDPYAGLLPPPADSTTGRGLWITHQSCTHVTTSRDETGWTVRMTAE
ncbi:sensor histidine kinase [Actinoplanes sp. RD1]|uniref:sensor histidine kinase n=1 Tax=Actinoplanes sp. RD1 TaxID=3064538 RepID=UPI002742522E|nr:sensor histidine kinase [Actinoplanes sp. RD1]